MKQIDIVMWLLIISVLGILGTNLFNAGFNHAGKKLCRSMDMELKSSFAVGDYGIRNNVWCMDENSNFVYIKIKPEFVLSEKSE